MQNENNDNEYRKAGLNGAWHRWICKGANCKVRTHRITKPVGRTVVGPDMLLIGKHTCINIPLAVEDVRTLRSLSISSNWSR